MLAILAVALDDLMAVDTTPGRYILERPRICADRLNSGSGSQARDPVLKPNYWKRTKQPPAIQRYYI
jgi:hypothetical protein